MPGDYLFYQHTYTNKTCDVQLVAADSSKVDIGGAVKSANHRRYVQKVIYTPTTVAAQAITLRDDAGTPVPIGLIPASVAAPYVLDFGPAGIGLSLGKNLD